MENLSMCRICLATDVRLCSIASHLRDMYERISSMTFKREDGRPQVACYICHARLQTCYRLRMSCLQGEELLTEMMSRSELKPQNVLSTNSFRLVSALHLSLGHAVHDSTGCQVKEETPEIIHDDELKDQEEQFVEIDDYNQCSYLDDPLDIIKGGADDVVTDDDIKLEIEDTILEENDPNVAGSCLQLADNICPKIVKIVLQRIDVNDITTDTEDATNSKRKIKAEKNAETKNITIKEPKIVTKETRVEKPVTTILEVSSIVNNVCEEKSTNNTSSEHNVSSISINKNNQFFCDTCDKCFNKKSYLKTHIRIHTGEKPFRCNLCKKCFNQKTHLNNHIRRHTSEKPNECNFCKKGFNTKDDLQKHIRIHTGDLKKHIRTHTGEKPYQCNLCKKCFNQRSHLKNHIRRHSSEKPHECNFCKKCFTTKDDLQKHIRIHTGDLKKHIRTHTGEKPYRCDICKKGFIQKNHLRNHSELCW